MTGIWGTIAIVAVAVVIVSAIITVIVATYARIPLEKKYENAGGGFGGAFDAVWMPSAHEAGVERDRQTKRTAPAPAPGDPPWTIDEGRITLDV
ncbi:hypothetical protein [Streptomyces sp. AC495_CC817]|uniref:hypothetical protein n=1 Tax=Streptomyces sp. AC495_CC817 TaxID=2823900 RepID=UPI001C25FB8F|nr:hypothetical protein [Streptomyces sp. AC495_CC817]